MTDDSIGEHFGRQVRQAREARGLTARALAAMCGRTQGWVTLLEGVHRETRVEDADALARALGVPLLSLLDPGVPCEHCQGLPPAGYRCLTCGTQTARRAS